MTNRAIPLSAESKVADRHVIRLYKAVANYVEHAGGKVVVSGGIEIQTWPGDRKYQFTVAIKCTGTKPKFAQEPRK